MVRQSKEEKRGFSRPLGHTGCVPREATRPQHHKICFMNRQDLVKLKTKKGNHKCKRMERISQPCGREDKFAKWSRDQISRSYVHQDKWLTFIASSELVANVVKPIDDFEQAVSSWKYQRAGIYEYVTFVERNRSRSRYSCKNVRRVRQESAPKHSVQQSEQVSKHGVEPARSQPTRQMPPELESRVRTPLDQWGDWWAWPILRISLVVRFGVPWRPSERVSTRALLQWSHGWGRHSTINMSEMLSAIVLWAQNLPEWYRLEHQALVRWSRDPSRKQHKQERPSQKQADHRCHTSSRCHLSEQGRNQGTSRQHARHAWEA